MIRGDKDENAVLCSKDKTYDMKIADTSNMLLFIPGCKTPDQMKMEETHCNIIHTEVLSSVSWFMWEWQHVLILRLIKNSRCGTSLAVQWLKFRAPNTGGNGWIPGRGN